MAFRGAEIRMCGDVCGDAIGVNKVKSRSYGVIHL